MGLLVALFIAGAIPFIVVVRIGLRSPVVRGSPWRQFALLLLACLAGLITIVVLALFAVRAMFQVT